MPLNIKNNGLINILEPLLVEFQWYRKHRGGTWYKIIVDQGYGFQGSIICWTKDLNSVEEYQLLEKEEW